MSILAAEGFDDGMLHGTGFGNAVPSIQTSPTMTGSRVLRVQTFSAFNTSYYRAADLAASPISTGFIYFHFRFDSPGTTVVVCQGNDAADTVAHFNLRLGADGRFRLYFSSTATTLLATSNLIYRVGTWIHVAIKFVIDNTTGSLEVRFNGSSSADMSFSGDTRNGTPTTVGRVYLANAETQPAFAPYYFDNVIVQDAGGSAPENDWLGEAQIDYVLPDGDGDNTDWAIGGSSPAATSWQSIDEVPPDDGVTLVEDNTVAQRVLATFAALPIASLSFIAARISARMAKQSATARGVKLVAKSAGTSALGSEKTLATSYANYSDIMHDDPNGNQWSDANFDAAQFGAEVTT